MRKGLIAGAAAAGAALFGGAAIYYLREKSAGEPDFRPLRSDGDFQIRAYPAITVAETIAHGRRKEALGDAFGVLADYIAARSRDGEALTMTVPVMQDGGDPMACDPPLFDDDLAVAGWRTRFVMPEGRTAEDLPEPPDEILLIELPARRVAVVNFSGRADDRMLAHQEDRLRGWLTRLGEKAGSEPEYAFYNSPKIPGPLRRNEVWLVLD